MFALWRWQVAVAVVTTELINHGCGDGGTNDGNQPGLNTHTHTTVVSAATAATAAAVHTCIIPRAHIVI